MKTIIKAARVVLWAAVIVVALSQMGALGLRWAYHVIVVDPWGVTGLTTLTEAVKSAKDGWTIYAWPGTYAEKGISITDSVTVCGIIPLRTEASRIFAPQIWQDNGELWRIGAGGYLKIINFYCRQTGTDSLARCNDRSWEADHCVFEFDVFTHTGDTTGIGQQGKNLTHFFDCTFLPRVHRGMINRSDSSIFVNCTVGKMLLESEAFFGPYVANGVEHHRGKTNIYSDSTGAVISGGNLVIYDGGILATVTDTLNYAVNISGGSLVFYGGEIQNNDPNLATVNISGAGFVNIEKTVLHNKATAGPAYNSTSSAVSTLAGIIWKGHAKAWCAGDLMDFQSHFWTEADVAKNDAWPLLRNLSNMQIVVEMMQMASSADSDTVALLERDGTGGAVSSLDGSICIGTDGTSSYYSPLLRFADIDDPYIAAGDQIWINHSDATSNPSAWLSAWIYYVEICK